MATATRYTTGDRQPSRWLRNGALLAVLALAVVLGFSWRGLREEARVSTSYGARLACACRFVSQRDMGSCKGDIAVAGLGRTASFMMLSEDEQARTVTASVPLLAGQTATFAPDRGCQLEPWAG